MDTQKVQTSSPNRVIANTPQEVYAGGALIQIEPEDLLENALAIRQLMNERNNLSSKIDSKDIKIEELNRQIENSKTPPLLSIFSTALAVIGGIMLNVAKSNFEDQNNSNINSWLILVGGAIVSFAAVIIINPAIRNWVPKSSK